MNINEIFLSRYHKLLEYIIRPAPAPPPPLSSSMKKTRLLLLLMYLKKYGQLDFVNSSDSISDHLTSIFLDFLEDVGAKDQGKGSKGVPLEVGRRRGL